MDGSAGVEVVDAANPSSESEESKIGRSLERGCRFRGGGEIALREDGKSYNTPWSETKRRHVSGAKSPPVRVRFGRGRQSRVRGEQQLPFHCHQTTNVTFHLKRETSELSRCLAQLSRVLMSTYHDLPSCSEPTSGGYNIEASSVPPPPSEHRVKHADLWFCDGSVVLQAESVLFRVHKSQLSRRSVIFSDMFTLPQPPVITTHATLADETYEGCPVIKLHDSAEDVANLLLALYDGPFVSAFLFFFFISRSSYVR